jgi:hypothetical protein
MHARIPPKNHILYKPITWTQDVWRQIIQYQGNPTEITRLFNLFPAIEAYIEDTISLHLMRNIIQDSTNILLDDYVKIQTDDWETERATQNPSVLQQMCTAQKSQNFLSKNFYFPLPIQTDHETAFLEFYSKMAENINPVSTTQKSPVNPFDVDIIDMDNLASLISEQQQRDSDFPIEEQEAHIGTTQESLTADMYVHRIDIKRLFRTPEKRSEVFKKFFIALKKVDPHAAVRPVYTGDNNKIPILNSSTQVHNPDLLDIDKYHKSWTPNQRYGLSGQIVIETSHPFDDLVDKLFPWLNSTYYQIMLADCQTSELVTIGVLIRVSYTLCRTELIANTKAIISRLKGDSQFDFTIRADHWFCSIGRVNVLFVAVARDKLKPGMEYFCNMYNGVNTKVPMGATLLFIPLYQIQLTQEIREQIGQEQRAWQDSEIACFVNGFKDLSSIITLKDGTTCSLRSLILRLPNDSKCPRKALFHGVDRRPESEDWIAIKYHRDDEATFKKRAPGIAYELAQIVVDTDIPKLFVNPTVGLNFGGEWRNSFSANTKNGRRVNPKPTDPALLTHFQSVLGKLQPAVVKRPAITPEPRRYSPQLDTAMNSSYARAASTTFTSTTYNNNSNQVTPGNRQTRTESVVVIEQYEARFVHVESRLTSVEKSVNKSGDMLAKLLRHNGIDVEDEETMAPSGGPMEIEQQRSQESGSKRICPTSQRTLSQHALSNSDHA